ncbi:hypothetical protein JTE90_012769 [Oedothorax gibbosus]|uniref:Secreted protein n=1 Tax=Oedothorax gibbosus TaxID=931172 RepID=A0AAV6VYH4_9ARAC|nr:hypothetical protein JTE90_012769 [Oedothorax gibbosus]
MSISLRSNLKSMGLIFISVAISDSSVPLKVSHTTPCLLLPYSEEYRVEGAVEVCVLTERSIEELSH